MREHRRPPARPLPFPAWVVLAVVVHVVILVTGDYARRLWPDPPAFTPPEEVEVVWIESTSPDVDLPDPDEALAPESEPEPEERHAHAPPPKLPDLALERPPELARGAQPPPPPAPVPKPKQVVPELAIIKPPPPPILPPPPEPPKDQPKPPLAQMERMKFVEVDDDKNVVKEPSPDAHYWSDKNRAVAIETHDTRTNLDKQMKGKGDASAESDDQKSEDVGGKDEKVRQLEDSDPSSLDRKKAVATVHNGDAERARGIRVGVEGDEGEGGQNGGGQGGKPGALSMRNVEGRGAPGGQPAPRTAPSAGEGDDAPEVALSTEPGGAEGAGHRPGRDGRRGKPGRKGLKLKIEAGDYKRIVGEDTVAEEEREIARRQKSHKKGRWEKKLEGIHSSLENFTPEVRPGNQTALGTRAHPFALYIARMHRAIHELWGFGFLEDLDGKPASNPMNDRQLAVKMEIVVNADGVVDKVTIVDPSGVLTFDVAAIDTVMSAGPYEETPEDIRSPDGKVYLHWTFHRDERMCTPYFADPFILDKPPGEGKEARGLPEPSDEVARRKRNPERITRTGDETDGKIEIPRVTRAPGEDEGDTGAAARANVNTPTPDDPAAEATALAWADAFEDKDVAGMIAVSAAPFSANGAVAARSADELRLVWKTVLDETRDRTIDEWKLFSAAGYRAVFGSLPAGGEDGTAKLYLVIQLEKERLILHVTQDAEGQYRVTGLSR